MNNNIKICAIDIDGVLCYYPDDWLKFIKKETGERFDYLWEAKNTLPFSLYRKLKKRYRDSGIKKEIRPRPFAIHLTHKLESLGYTIILLTARPIYENKNVLVDTLYWLKKNNIKHDLIFNGKDKHIKLLKYFKEIKFAIEDNHEVANQIAEAGFKVYLVNNVYNENRKIDKRVKRIDVLDEVEEIRRN